MNLTQEQKSKLQIIRLAGAVSKKAFAEKCGISIPKAASLITSLEEKGLLEIIEGASSGGRIPQLVKIKGDLFYTLAIDIGMEFLRMGLVDMDGKVAARTKTGTNIDEPRTIEIDDLYSDFLRLCGESGIDRKQVKGIGIGLTGIVHEKEGLCLSLRNTPQWKGFNLKEAVSDKFGIDNVFIMDSVKAMTIAEQRFGKASGLSDFIFLNIGIGLGAGIVVNGEIISGDRGTSGEIGHMHIRPSEEICVCGNSGCLEAMASGWALLRKCKKALKEGVETSIADNKEIDNLGVRDIIEAANTGDKIATMMIELMSKDISVGIGSIINLLNPEKIFLGGGLIRHAYEIMIDPILRGTRSAVIPWLQKNIDIELSEIGEWDCIIGAGSIAADKVIEVSDFI